MAINKDHVLKAGQLFYFQNYTDQLSLMVEHNDSDDVYFRTIGLTPGRQNFKLDGPIQQKDPWFYKEMTFVGDFHDLYRPLKAAHRSPPAEIKRWIAKLADNDDRRTDDDWDSIIEAVVAQFLSQGRSKDDFQGLIEKAMRFR